MKIAVYTNPTKTDNHIKRQVIKLATKLGYIVDEINPDVVFACGGDGTILRAVHAYIDKLDSVKFFGANYGNMGFFYDYESEEIESALNDLKNDKLFASKHLLIEGELYKKNRLMQNICGVNEIRIENNTKPLLCDVYINDSLFEKYVGTGVVVSTSIGSTAYNLTLSGSAVLTNFETLQLTLVQPSKQHQGFKYSLVMDPNTEIKFDFSKYGHDVLLGYDFVVDEQCRFDFIKIRSSKKTFTLLSKSEEPQYRLRKLFN